MNIGDYRAYCEENFQAQSWSEKIHDKRKRLQITGFQVFNVVSQMPVFAQKSLAKVDGFLKLPEVRAFHKSSRRMVASDSSIRRITAVMAVEPIRAMGYEVIDKADEHELWDLKLPSGRKLRMGIMDGHHAGGVWASVFAVSGKAEGVVDLKRYHDRGHELKASRMLARRVFRNLGNGYFGIVAGDGLYANREDFQWFLDHKSHLLVKTDEEPLTIVKDARYFFNLRDSDALEGIERVAGCDEKRSIEYQVMWTEGMDWQGLKLTVAWVREHHLKPRKGQTENAEFWVLTTAAGLTGEDLRELAHRRWEIENNVFKRLNFLVKSKKHWSRNTKVMELFLRMWMIGLTLLGAYLFERGWKKFKACWGAVLQTWDAAAERMYVSLIRLFTG